MAWNYQLSQSQIQIKSFCCNFSSFYKIKWLAIQQNALHVFETKFSAKWYNMHSQRLIPLSTLMWKNEGAYGQRRQKVPCTGGKTQARSSWGRREEKESMKSMVDIMKQSTVANKSFQDTMSMFMQAMITQQTMPQLLMPQPAFNQGQFWQTPPQDQYHQSSIPGSHSAGRVPRANNTSQY